MNDDMLALPRAMAFQDGVIYQASLHGVVAEPATGGDALTLVADSPATGVWVEGDNVLYANNDQLFTVPRAGGDATLLLDGGHQNDPSTSAGGNDYIGDKQLLDDTAFYWTTRAYPNATDGNHAWRMLRAGGAVEGFALFPIEMVDGLAVTADGVLAAGQSVTLGGPFYRAFVAPFAHGAARELPLTPNPDKIVSAESSSLLFNVYTGAREGRSETHELWLSPTDGSPARPLAYNLPLELFTTWSVPDGQGGHVLGGVEIFDDGAIRGTVFQVGGDGNATRLACDASGNYPLFTATALAPDAVYVAVRYDRPAWTLIEIPRPSAKN